MRRKFVEWICISGILWIPIFTIGTILIKALWLGINGNEYLITYDEIRPILGISVVVAFVIFLKNLLWLDTPRKIGLFTWLEKFDYDFNESDRKHRAQYPPINKEYLSRVPDGLVLGKKGKDFIRVPIKKGNVLNSIIMGSTGCGKSTLVLTTLLYEFHFKKDATFFALDIKPELARKCTVIKGNESVHVMDPEDRASYGWDVYYRLNKDSTDDDIMTELDIIARALIDAGKADKNEFFYQSARIIFKGVMFWTYKQGRSFMQGLNYLMDGNISEVIQRTMEAIEGKVEFKVVKRLLSPYACKKGEAFEGIEMSFRERLDSLTGQSLQFFLDINPRKASPMDLENKVSIFFALHENKLKEYNTLLRLVTMQVMDHCSRRDEDSHMITLIIDEAFRLGAINWIDFLSTSRSRQVSTILAFQSLAQMERTWCREEAKSLIELCRVLAVLSCADPETANMLSSWVGDYKEVKHSIGEKVTYSYEDKKTLRQSDIMELQERGEVLLFIKGKYFRANVTGARYYNIPELNKISERCRTINATDDTPRYG